MQSRASKWHVTVATTAAIQNFFQSDLALNLGMKTLEKWMQNFLVTCPLTFTPDMKRENAGLRSDYLNLTRMVSLWTSKGANTSPRIRGGEIDLDNQK